MTPAELGLRELSGAASLSPCGQNRPVVASRTYHCFSTMSDTDPTRESRASMFTRWLAGGILIAAAGLKGYALSTAGTAADGSILSRFEFQAMLVLGEWLLGVWLISGIFPRLAMRFAAAVFALLAGAASGLAISGAESCGCFGSVRVNPWITVAIDAALAVLLTLLSRTPLAQTPLAQTPLTQTPREADARVPAASSSGRPAPSGQVQPGFARLAVTLAVMGLVAGPGLAWLMASRPIELVNASQLPVTGRLIELRGSRWVGKPFPLASRIPGGEAMLRGEWIVMFYRIDCPACLDKLPLMQSLPSRTPYNAAAVEIPPPRPHPPGLFTRSDRRLPAKLDPRHAYAARTPQLVRLKDGMVIDAGEAVEKIIRTNAQ